MSFIHLHRILRPLLLLALISDFSIGGNPLLRVNFLVALYFLPKIFRLIRDSVLLVALLQLISLFGVLCSAASILDVFYTFFVWVSLIQIGAVVYLVLDLRQLSTTHSNSSDPVLILVWLLVLIGLLQFAFGFERPPFVFYETNYIALWFPLLLTMSFLRSYLYASSGSSPATILYTTIIKMVLPALFLLALSQSISFLVSLFLIFIFYLLATSYLPLFRSFRRLSLSLPIFRFISFIVLAVVVFLAVFSNFSDLLVSRVYLLLRDPDLLVGISGLRYLTYQTAKNFFSSLDLLSMSLGGFFAQVRAFPILVNGEDLVVIPLSGLFALLLQYGLLGMSLVLIHSLFLLRRILSMLPGLFSVFLVYMIVMAFFAICVLTNLTYAGVLVFAGIAFAALKQSLAFSGQQTALIPNASNAPTF